MAVKQGDNFRGQIPRVFLFVALSVPSAALAGVGSLPSVSAIFWSLFFSVLVAFCAPFRLFKSVVAVFVFLLPFSVAWISYASFNGAGPAVESVGSIFATNRHEVTVALAMSLTRVSFLIPAIVHIASLLLAWTSASRLGVAKIFAPVVLIGLLIIFSLQLWQGLSSQGQRVWNSSTFASSLVLSYLDWSISAFETGFWHNDWRLHTDRRRDSVVPVKKPGSAQVAIFVIGESTRYGALGLSPNSRGTWSDLLQARIERSKGAWMPPVCSPADFTSASVPLMITGLSPEKYSEAATAPTLANRLRAAGYRVAWIRNQDDVFGDADFVWDAPYAERATYDYELVEPTERFLAPIENGTDDAPRAVVLHMAGAHVPYASHYPEAMFPVEQAELTQDERDEVEYGRANQAEARALVELGEMLDRLPVPAVLIFVSDHGENLPSDHNGLRLHMAARVSLAADLVPAIALWNASYFQTHAPSALLSSLMSARRIAQRDVYESFLVLADLSDGPILPTADPKVRGVFEKGGSLQVASCYALSP